MEHLKNLTSQQLAMAASWALLCGIVMLSSGSKLGYLPLAIGVACGLGAFAKSKKR